MPRLNMLLEEQLSDKRSSEVAFRVRVENLGATPLDLRSISPRIPEGVSLLEIKDSSAEALRTTHKRLCDELTELLNEHVFETSADARAARLRIEKQFVDEVVKDTSAILKTYLRMFTGRWSRRFEERRAQLHAQMFVIAKKADADIALKRWFHDLEAKTLYGQMYQAKVEQLAQVEAVLDKRPEETAIATIEPDSFFATTYVLRFPRTSFNPAKYTFSVEAALSETGSPKESLSSASTTVEISARPYVLSCITVLCALLGVAVKYSIDRADQLPVDEFFGGLGNQLATGRGISSAVLALVAFNLYEHLDLGEKLSLRVGWRSAMLFGVLSGLFSERIVAALKTLVGA